jgi:hypothetical protein
MGERRSRHRAGRGGRARRSRHPPGRGARARPSPHRAGRGGRARRSRHPPGRGARARRSPHRAGRGGRARRSQHRAAPTRPRFCTRRSGNRNTRRTIRRAVTSHAALRNMAALLTCQPASGSRAVERRLRHGRVATAGTMARPLGPRRRTGKVRRRLVAGTDRRLPVAGTVPGLGRRAT